MDLSVLLVLDYRIRINFAVVQKMLLKVSGGVYVSPFSWINHSMRYETMTITLTYADAVAIAGTPSNTSKMPGKSIGLSAFSCKTGSKLATVPGSVCSKCYALKGFYRMPSVVKANNKREAGLSHPQWVEAMVVIINHSASFAVPEWRWFDSGDIQSIGHLMMIVEVAKRTPLIKHWAPTKELKMLRAFIKGGGVIPSNLIVRASSPMIDQAPVRGHANTSTVSSSVDTLYTGHRCEAYRTDKSGVIVSHEDYVGMDRKEKKARDFGHCGTCRKCWSADIENVDYLQH